MAILQTSALQDTIGSRISFEPLSRLRAPALAASLAAMTFPSLALADSMVSPFMGLTPAVTALNMKQDPEADQAKTVAALKEQIAQKQKLIEAYQGAVTDSMKQIEEITKNLQSLNAQAEGDKKRIEALQGAVDVLKEASKKSEQELAAQRAEVDKLQVKLNAAEKELAVLSERVSLSLRFKLIDVYLDGSLGKDTWTLKTIINGTEHVLWNRAKNISDDGTSGNGPGPKGDKNSTRYGLDKEISVVVRPTDEVVVQVVGTAHDKNRGVPLSSITLSAGNGWGTDGTTYGPDKKTHVLDGVKLNRIGDGNGNVEYWIFFSVDKK